LGCVALSADVTVIIASEALLHSAGAIVELALVYLAVPYHSGVDDGVGHFQVCEFKYYRGCTFEGGFFGEPSYVGDFCFRDYCVGGRDQGINWRLAEVIGIFTADFASQTAQNGGQ
jgi:hypothetical protein